jgi:uncharacterized protein (TIGR02246 family)
MARSDIDALRDTLIRGVEKGDAALIASLYAPDARLLPPGAEAVTGEGIQAYWQSFLDMGVTGGRLDLVTFEERDDLAVQEGRYEVTNGSEVLDTGKFVDVSRRQPDGSWKLIIDIFNSSQTPAAD